MTDYTSLLDDIKVALYQNESLENQVIELKKDKERLIRICYRLTEGIYKYIGDNLGINYLIQLVDSCIGDEKYKEFLMEKYIKKSLYNKPSTWIYPETIEDSDSDWQIDKSKLDDDDLNAFEIIEDNKEDK